MRIVGFILVITTILFGFYSVYQFLPPKPIPASGPATVFSAERAMKHDQAIAKKPHPAGSLANVEVRAYIVEQLRTIGIEPVEWTDYYIDGHSAGETGAVLGRIRGTANTKAVGIMAHYDSVPYGPGAADDGSGVSAILEIARAVKASPPLMNDVIFIFTDGEECGLLGAKAFSHHPWNKDVGVLINLEARGNRGTSYMFETSPENGWLIKQLAKSHAFSVASSCMYDVYKRMPFSSDFGQLKSRISGVNFAFVDNFAHYHTKNDVPGNLDLASLQHHGTDGLELVRHFGAISLVNTKGPDATYFNLFGHNLVYYPLSWGKPLAVGGIVLFIIILVLGLIRKRLSIGGLAGGILTFILAAISAFVVVLGLLAVVYGPGKLYALYSDNITHLNDLDALHQNSLYGTGFLFGGIAVIALIYGVFSRWLRVENLLAGALLWWGVLLVVLELFLPGGTYLAVWPFVAVSMGLGVVFLLPDTQPMTWNRVLFLSVCALVGIHLHFSTYYAFLATVMIIAGPFLASAMVWAISLLVPQLVLAWRSGWWAIPGVAALCACGFLGVGFVHHGPNAQQPRFDCLSYGLDLDKGKAYWLSGDEQPDEWTAQFFQPGMPKQDFSEFVYGSDAKCLKAEAPVSDRFQGPTVEMVRDSVADGYRELAFLLASPAHAPRMDIHLEGDTEVVSASVMGRPVDVGKGWYMSFNLFPSDGVEIALRVREGAPVVLKATEQLWGLPSFPDVKSRPEYLAPTPNTIRRSQPMHSERVYVTKTFDCGTVPKS